MVLVQDIKLSTAWKTELHYDWASEAPNFRTKYIESERNPLNVVYTGSLEHLSNETQNDVWKIVFHLLLELLGFVNGA